MPRSIEEIVYEYMCAGCEREYYCHNACENCEEYEDEIEKLEKAQRENKNDTK